MTEKYVDPSSLTIAGVGIELANIGDSELTSNLLYFDKSITFAISVGRFENGLFRQDICFVNRDSETVANMRLGGGSQSTACSTEDYFAQNFLLGDRAPNYAGFSLDMLRLAAPRPLPDPGPNVKDDGVRHNNQTDKDIAYVGEILRRTIERADLTVVITGNTLVLHHFITQFPELAEILYPTVKVSTKDIKTADKINYFPPKAADVGFRTDLVGALRPLKSEDTKSMSRVKEDEDWKKAIKILEETSQQKGAVPINFLELFRAWNAGLDVQIKKEDLDNDHKDPYTKIWEAIQQKEMSQIYWTKNGTPLKGITSEFVLNCLFGVYVGEPPISNDSWNTKWPHGEYVQGHMLGALLATRFMLTRSGPTEPYLPQQKP